MTERLFPTLAHTDLIVHTYEGALPRALMDTDETPGSGSTVEFDSGSRVTFQGSFVRRGEPGPDAHLFSIAVDSPDDGEAIAEWLSEALGDDLLARVETPDGFVDLETDDLVATFEDALVAD